MFVKIQTPLQTHSPKIKTKIIKNINNTLSKIRELRKLQIMF